MENRTEALILFMLVVMAMILDFTLFMSMIISITIVATTIQNYVPKALDFEYAYNILLMIVLFMIMTISLNNFFNVFI